LFDVAIEMEPEDGVIWVYGPDDEGEMAFTDSASKPDRSDQNPQRRSDNIG